MTKNFIIKPVQTPTEIKLMVNNSKLNNANETFILTDNSTFSCLTESVNWCKLPAVSPQEGSQKTAESLHQYKN